MGQITIRGMDPDFEHMIRKAAEKSGKSLNRVILEMLYGHNKSKKSPQASPSESLKKLAGGWSEKEASDFMEIIKPFEQIDEDMWK